MDIEVYFSMPPYGKDWETQV